MPQDKPPLADAEIELITRLDRPGGERRHAARRRSVRYDMDHPPVYTRLPVITALDFSPDGSLLAVGGFHEVLLWKADGSELVGRLVGLSERIESLAFSPDGKKLAVTGGLPRPDGRGPGLGRRQAEARPLGPRHLSTRSTARAGRPTAPRSPSAAPTTRVRAIDAKTGEQVLFMGSHNDWVLDTVFSADGSHLISVGRDMAAKLTEVATQRFVDNITSITPGALKGGIDGRRPASQARRDRRSAAPTAMPKLYRVFRQTVRVIGDDSNLIREFPPMPGRIYGVAVSPDGKRIAAGSSLDGTGEVERLLATSSTPALPRQASRRSMQKVVTTRSRRGSRPSWRSTTRRGSSRSPTSRCRRAGSTPSRSGPTARFWPRRAPTARPADRPRDRHDRQGVRPGHRRSQRSSVRAESARRRPSAPKHEEAVETETLPKGASLASLEVQPEAIRLTNRFAYVQLLVTGQLATRRDDRRDPDGRADALGRDRRGLAVGPGPAQGRRQGDAHVRPGRQDGRRCRSTVSG